MIIRYGLTGILFWLLVIFSAYESMAQKESGKSNVFVLMPVMVDLLIKKAIPGQSVPLLRKNTSLWELL